MRAPVLTPADLDFTDCDDSGAQAHVVEPITDDPDLELLNALMQMSRGPLYVPVGGVA